MKLVYLGAMATTMVVAIGLVMVVGSAYTHTVEHDRRLPSVMLSFSIVDESNAPEWCTALSSTLAKYGAKATVFVTGKVAERHPACVSAFSSLPGVDVGSQTYSYANLAAIQDYTKALEEVRSGKQAVDRAGNLDSRVFKAPYGSTDDNIYSFLGRSNITADFSYKQQYNKYENGQFVKYDLATYESDSYSSESVRNLASKAPVAITFDNSTPIEQIDSFVSALMSDGKIKVVNASELTGLGNGGETA